MPDRDKILKASEMCANGEPCMREKYSSCPFSPRNNPEENCGVTMDAISMRKEQETIIEELKARIKLPQKEQETPKAGMQKHKIPVQSLIDHIKTAIDVDPWATEMAENLLKLQVAANPVTDTLGNICCPRCYTAVKGNYCHCCGQKIKREEQ